MSGRVITGELLNKETDMHSVFLFLSDKLYLKTNPPPPPPPKISNYTKKKVPIKLQYNTKTTS